MLWVICKNARLGNSDQNYGQVIANQFLGSVLPIYTTMWVSKLIRWDYTKLSKPLPRPGWHQFLQYKCTQDCLPVKHYNLTKQCVYVISGRSKVCACCLLQLCGDFILQTNQ
jgi:hypothetical protein